MLPEVRPREQLTVRRLILIDVCCLLLRPASTAYMQVHRTNLILDEHEITIEDFKWVVTKKLKAGKELQRVRVDLQTGRHSEIERSFAID